MKIVEQIQLYEKSEIDNGRRAMGQGVFTLNDMIRVDVEIGDAEKI